MKRATGPHEDGEAAGEALDDFGDVEDVARRLLETDDWRRVADGGKVIGGPC